MENEDRQEIEKVWDKAFHINEYVMLYMNYEERKALLIKKLFLISVDYQSILPSFSTETSLKSEKRIKNVKSELKKYLYVDQTQCIPIYNDLIDLLANRKHVIKDMLHLNSELLPKYLEKGKASIFTLTKCIPMLYRNFIFESDINDFIDDTSFYFDSFLEKDPNIVIKEFPDSAFNIYLRVFFFSQNLFSCFKYMFSIFYQFIKNEDSIMNNEDDCFHLINDFLVSMRSNLAHDKWFIRMIKEISLIFNNNSTVVFFVLYDSIFSMFIILSPSLYNLPVSNQRRILFIDSLMVIRKNLLTICSNESKWKCLSQAVDQIIDVDFNQRSCLISSNIYVFDLGILLPLIKFAKRDGSFKIISSDKDDVLIYFESEKSDNFASKSKLIKTVNNLLSRCRSVDACRMISDDDFEYFKVLEGFDLEKELQYFKGSCVEIFEELNILEERLKIFECSYYMMEMHEILKIEHSIFEKHKYREILTNHSDSYMKDGEQLCELIGGSVDSYFTKSDGNNSEDPLKNRVISSLLTHSMNYLPYSDFLVHNPDISGYDKLFYEKRHKILDNLMRSNSDEVKSVLEYKEIVFQSLIELSQNIQDYSKFFMICIKEIVNVIKDIENCYTYIFNKIPAADDFIPLLACGFLMYTLPNCISFGKWMGSFLRPFYIHSKDWLIEEGLMIAEHYFNFIDWMVEFLNQ